MEEIGAGLRDVRYMGTIENIFTYGGEVGHEIVLVYEGELADETLYEKERLQGVEHDGSLFPVVWMPLDAFGGAGPLYPDGLLDMLKAQM